MRTEPTITVTCDGARCLKKAFPPFALGRSELSCQYPKSIKVDLFDLGLGDWTDGTVDESLRAEGWTSKDGRDLCPECSKETDNAK